MPCVRVLVGIVAAVVIAGCATTDPEPAATTDGPTALGFVAYDVGYDPVEGIVSAGTIESVLVNQGAAVRTVIVEGLDDLKVAKAGPDETDIGTVTLEPGTYTVYCDIPGHRSAGMDRIRIAVWPAVVDHPAGMHDVWPFL